jgi:Kef-type K+ transport system membrane component KefB
MFFFFAGNLISPPLGNKMADFAPGAPFVLWAGMALLGWISLMLTRPARKARA